MLEKISKENPKSKIFCMTILPVQEKKFAKNQLISDANKEIKNIVKNYPNATLIDTHKGFCDSTKKMIKKYTKDDLHLNKDGYSNFVDIIKPYILN